KILRKQERPKRAQPKPETPVDKQTPSAPPLFQSFAARIVERVKDEIEYANEHELGTITEWTPQEREDAIRLLTDLRDQLDRLLAEVKGVAK
ncbi:MAG: hypothetical protein ACKVS9_17950, partial [Phycisphaerae bacterium]